MDMMPPWHLVSPDYSPCANQIYILICSFIALRNPSSLHSYFESMCHYRVSESSYTYKHTGRCIEAFLHYFHNKASSLDQIFDYLLITLIVMKMAVKKLLNVE